MRAHPIYLSLEPGELRNRATEAVTALAACRLCPRECGVDRFHDRWSACKTGRYAVLASAFPHHGEEDCLRGWYGSGTLFFGHCNLRCVFCQNHDISQDLGPGPATPGASPERIAAAMLGLQARGCHNINLVTPEHVVPQVLEAIALAVEDGLRLPLVYNTSAYDGLDSLSWLDGVVDIYMPDFKLWTAGACRRYLVAEDYPVAARAAIREMHRQVGSLRFDDDGLAVRGVLVRHLVMPGMVDESRAILEWLARELGNEAYVNVMAQYFPAWKVGGGRFGEIDRPVTSAEFAEVVHWARELGLRLDERRPTGRGRPLVG